MSSPCGDARGVCAVCGSPAELRCARCRGVFYCDAKCQRAAWGAHKSACAAAVAAAAADRDQQACGGRGVVGTGGGGGSAAGAAHGYIEPAAAVAAAAAPAAALCGGHHCTEEDTGGLDASALRETATAVAMLHSTSQQSAGIMSLIRVAAQVSDSNRHRYEFERALLAAGGVAPLVRILASGRGDAAAAAALVHELVLYSVDVSRAFGVAGAVEPLVAMLKSPNPAIAEQAAYALCNLCRKVVDNATALVSAGGLRPLIALLGSSSLSAQESAAGAVRCLCTMDSFCDTISVAGGIPPLVAVLKAGSILGQDNASGALVNLSRRSGGLVAIAAAGGIPSLTALLKSPSPEVKLNAATALLNMSLHNDEIKLAIAAARGIPALILLLRTTSGEMQERVVRLVRSLMCYAPTLVAVAEGGAIPRLVAVLIQHHQDLVLSSRKLQRSLTAALLLVCCSAFATRVVAAGAFLPLTALQKSADAEVRSFAAPCVFMLAEFVADGISHARTAVAVVGVRQTVLALLEIDAPRGARTLMLLSSDAESLAVMKGAGALEALRAFLPTAANHTVRDAVAKTIAALQ